MAAGELFDPEAETRVPADQRARDEAAYRAQVEYLFARSAFYRDKLRDAGFKDAKSVGGLDDLHNLPFTAKDELRASQAEHGGLGRQLAAPLDDVVRIFSTSGTSGAPLYIPLTRGDLERWVLTSMRSYFAAGIRPWHRVVTTYNAGPFVAGAVLDSLVAMGCRLVPVGSGNTDRLLTALERFDVQSMPATPSYLVHIAEVAAERGLDLKACGLQALVCGGEPGGSEPALRGQIEAAFGVPLCEVMGVGDIGISLWGEGPEQDGMSFMARDHVHVELIDPESGEVLPFEDGAEGELVYTHLRHEAAPLLRFRSRDHVVVRAGPVASGRTGPRVRCIGRTDDMLIVRGVNLFPSAVREVVDGFRPAASGMISIRPAVRGVRQPAPLRILVELGEGTAPQDGLARQIEDALRARLIISAAVELVPFGTLPRTDYKARLVDYADARD